jgi:hypothetical protein
MIVWSYCHMAILPDVPVPRGKPGYPNLGVGKGLLCMAWARDAEGRLRSAPEACSSRIVAQLAARSSSNCGSAPCSSVETRA